MALLREHVYQEMAALERFNGKGLRLVIESQLIAGARRRSFEFDKTCPRFRRENWRCADWRLELVDARARAQVFRAAMKKGRHGERLSSRCR